MIEWRANLSKNWESVKYCGEKCRRNKKTLHNDYEAQILALLQRRPSESTICPSEILPAELKKDPTQMELVRQAARRLVHQNKIRILQKGKEVDPSDFRGPIRLALIRLS